MSGVGSCATLSQSGIESQNMYKHSITSGSAELLLPKISPCTEDWAERGLTEPWRWEVSSAVWDGVGEVLGKGYSAGRMAARVTQPAPAGGSNAHPLLSISVEHFRACCGITRMQQSPELMANFNTKYSKDNPTWNNDLNLKNIFLRYRAFWPVGKLVKASVILCFSFSPHECIGYFNIFLVYVW